jgi:hypothetical protein
MKPLFNALLFISLLALYTCRNDEDLVCTDKNTYKIHPRALDFFFFKEGSWWVYEERTFGYRDSIWAARDQIKSVNPPNSGKRTCKCGWGHCVQEANTYFENEKFNLNTTGGFLFAYNLGVAPFDQSVEIIDDGGTYFTSEYKRWVVKNGVITSGSDKIQLEALDSILVNGTLYKDIIHTWYEDPGSANDWLLEAWYAKNFHLVKFRDSKGIWELQKCNIIQ